MIEPCTSELEPFFFCLKHDCAGTITNLTGTRNYVAAAVNCTALVAGKTVHQQHPHESCTTNSANKTLKVKSWQEECQMNVAILSSLWIRTPPTTGEGNTEPAEMSNKGHGTQPHA